MKRQFDKIHNYIHRHRYDFFVLTLLVVVTAVLFDNRASFEVFQSKESFERFIDGFGHWGPIVIILSIAFEVVVAPIPGYVPAITAGFAFGPILGSVYVYLGNMIGTLVVFFLARKYGKKLVEHFVEKKRLEKYAKMINRHENWLLFFYFIPIVPIDIITVAFGLSKIHIKKFMTVASIGYVLYSVVSTNFGDYVATLWF
ncbi:MAG: TVP38/TMEM64 family protein [Patescibacteria group bacterium]|nr:TVP38/TMEM64 family protein [Patescibacteria group bacterium]